MASVASLPSTSDVFDASQTSFTTHRKLINQLTKKCSEDSFIDEFFTCIDCFLHTPKKRSPCVDRFIKFLVQFLQQKNKEEIAFSLLNHLISRSSVDDKVVRYRSCQLIAAVINGFGSDIELP